MCADRGVFKSASDRADSLDQSNAEVRRAGLTGFVLRSFVTVVFIAVLASEALADANSVNGFFESGMVDRVVGDSVVTSRPDLFIFLRNNLHSDKKPKFEQAKLQEPAPVEPLHSDPEKSELTEREKIFAEFGDPETDPTINVVDNAPKPFKAMMRALDFGDDELAFDYARQYVRYLDRHKERVSRVTSLVGHAGEAEGVLGQGDWQRDKLYGDERELLEKYKQRRTSEEAKGEVKSLDVRAADLLKEAKGARLGSDTASQQPTSEVPQIDEAAERTAIARKIAGKVPVDPRGEVDVLFFFGTRDEQSAAMFDQIDQLAIATKSTEEIDIVGLSLDRAPTDALQAFARETKLNFPLLPGTDMAEKLKIKRSPTVVIVARTTGQAVYEEGFRPFYYLDEVRQAMQGKGSWRKR